MPSVSICILQISLWLINIICFNGADLAIGFQFSSLTGRGGENIAQADAALRMEQIDSNTTSLSGTGQERLPSPASLAEVMLSSRQLLTEQVGECLLVCYLKAFYLLHMFSIIFTFVLLYFLGSQQYIPFFTSEFSCLRP
jgi:hypothetical protein